MTMHMYLNKKRAALFLFAVYTSSFLLCGCSETDNNKTEPEKSYWIHKIELSINPHNLTKNESPTFSVIILDTIPKGDMYYYVNRTSFTPENVDKKIIGPPVSKLYSLQLTCYQNENMTLNRHDTKYPYDIFSDFYYLILIPGPSFEITWVNGSYEYLEINYFEEVTTTSYMKKAEASFKIYEHKNYTIETDYYEDYYDEGDV